MFSYALSRKMMIERSPLGSMQQLSDHCVLHTLESVCNDETRCLSLLKRDLGFMSRDADYTWQWQSWWAPSGLARIWCAGPAPRPFCSLIIVTLTLVRGRTHPLLSDALAVPQPGI